MFHVKHRPKWHPSPKTRRTHSLRRNPPTAPAKKGRGDPMDDPGHHHLFPELFDELTSASRPHHHECFT